MKTEDAVKSYVNSMNKCVQKHAIIYTLNTYFLKNVSDVFEEISHDELVSLFDTLKLCNKANESINNLKKIIFNLFKFHNLTINPMDGIKIDYESTNSPYTSDDLLRLEYAFSKSYYGNMYGLCLETGFRRSEILALSWDNISFSDRLIILDKRVDFELIKLVFDHPLKRTLSDRAIEYLNKQRFQQSKYMKASTTWWHNPDNLIFTDKIGRIISPVPITSSFSTIRRIAEVNEFNFDTMRRHYKAMLLERNLSLLC